MGDTLQLVTIKHIQQLYSPKISCSPWILLFHSFDNQIPSFTCFHFGNDTHQCSGIISHLLSRGTLGSLGNQGCVESVIKPKPHAIQSTCPLSYHSRP